MHPSVHSSTIYNSQPLEATYSPSVNEWVKNYGTFTQWNSMQQKERTPTLRDSIDRTRQYYGN